MTRYGVFRASSDLELFRRHAQVDFDLPVHHTHGIRVHREDRGQRPDLPGRELEARAVAGALHHAALELAFAERPALMRADVFDRPPGALLPVAEAQAP